MAISLRARFVFPVDRPPIENGVVTIEGSLIDAVGARAESGDVDDLGDVALLPGFVNAHTHLEFSYLPQPLGRPGIPFVEWIRLIIAERSRGETPDEATIRRAWNECQQLGVTTLGDIARGSFRLKEDVTHFYEVIGFSRARAESALNALVERIGFLSRPRGCFREGISPHAPYTVSPKLLHELVLRAKQHDLPIAMHLAESREELELLRDGTGPFRELLEERSMWDGGAIPPGSRPFDYLRMLAEAPRALVIHGNYLDEDELNFMGANRDRMSLVYCPRTHAYFFHPAYPLSKALSCNVRVALGTDSRASNPDLSLLEEMRFISRTHPAIEAHTILRMGTLGGAEALGRDFQVGSITPGKLANLVAVPIPPGARGTSTDVLAAVFASESQPSLTYAAGSRLDA